MENPNDQHEFGKSIAIAWFVQNLYCVSLPISTHLAYDLLIDNRDGKIKRVKVGTTSYKGPSGNYILNLRAMCANYYGSPVSREFDNTTIDYIFAFCDDGSTYFIPSCEVSQKTKITLSEFESYSVYLLSSNKLKDQGECPSG